MKGNNTSSGILTSFTSPYTPKIWRTSSLETDGSKLNITRVPWFKSLSDGFSCKNQHNNHSEYFRWLFCKTQKQSCEEVLLLVVLQQKKTFQEVPLGWKNGCPAFSSSEACSATHALHCVPTGYQNKISLQNPCALLQCRGF